MAAEQPARLRVAMDVTPLLGVRTGIGVFTDGAVVTLAERADLDLVGYGLTWNGYRHLPTLLPPGVRAVRVPMAAKPLLAAWRRVDGPVLEWWTGRVDVVHGTNFVVPPARWAAQVVSVYDLTAVHSPELCTPTARSYPDLVRRALARGAMVHTMAASVAADVMETFGLGPDRVRVVPSGFDRVGLRTGVGDNGDAAGLPDGAPYVLALGMVEPRKDLPNLVRAFDALAPGHPGLRLVIAGPSGWGEAALADAVGAAQHRDAIDRLGWVPDGRRRALLSGAAVLAFPSLGEGFGLPPLEAMSAGVPVVATAVGAVPEVVGDAAILVPAGDSEALAEALRRAIDDDGERARLIAAGHVRVAGYTWERCAEGLVSLYRDAVSAAGPPRSRRGRGGRGR